MALLDYLEDEAPQYQPPADFAANNDYKNQPEAVRNALKKRARDEGEAKIAEILGEKPDADPRSSIIRAWNNKEKTLRSQFETAYNEAFPKIEGYTAGAKATDFLSGINQGVLGVAKSAASLPFLSGYDGDVTKTLGGYQESLQKMSSDESRRISAANENRSKSVENSSLLEQVKAGFANLADNPYSMVGQGVGSLATVIPAAGLAVAGAPTAAVAGTGLALGIAVGLGGTKSARGDAVKKQAIASGLSETAANALALKASETTQDTILSDTASALLGGGETLIGAGGAILKGVKATAGNQLKQAAYKGAAKAASGESLPEIAQTVNDETGANLALTRAGYDTPTFQGVATKATEGGALGFALGGTAGGISQYRQNNAATTPDFTKLDTEAFNASMKDAPTAKAPRQQIANKVAESIASGKILDPNSQAGRIQANYLAAVKAKGTQNDGTGTGSGTLDGTTESLQTTDYYGADGSPTVLSDLLRQADGIERGDTEPANPITSIFETTAARVDGRTVDTADGGIADTAQSGITATGSTGETAATGEQRQRDIIAATNTNATATGRNTESQGDVSLESLAKYIPNETQSAANLRIKQAVDAGYTIDEVAQAQADSYKATQNPDADIEKFKAQTKAAYIGNDFVRPTVAQVQAITENGKPAFTESEAQMLAGNRMGLSEPIWDKAVTELRKKYESITGKPAITGANNGETKEALAVPVTGGTGIRATDSVGAVDGDKGQVNANPPSNPNPAVTPGVSSAVSSRVSVPDTNLQPNAGSGATVATSTEVAQPKAEADLAPIPKTSPEIRAAQMDAAKKAAKKRAQGLANALAPFDKQSPFLGWLMRNGIKRSEQSEWKDFKPSSIFTGPLFRKKGYPLDLLHTRAIEDGYLSQDSSVDDLYNLISRQAGGARIEPLYTEDGATNAVAEAVERQRAEYEDYLAVANEPSSTILTDLDFIPDDLEVSGYNDLSRESQARIQALLATANSLGVDADLILENVQYETTGKPDELYYSEAIKQLTEVIATRNASSSQDVSQQSQAPSQAEPEALVLQPTTPETNRAQQQQRDAEAQRREQGGDAPLPTRRITADTPDMFNTQGSVFDVPAEVIIQDNGKDKATTSNDSKLSEVEQKDNEVKYSRTTDAPFGGIEQARTPLGDTKTVTVNGKQYSVFNSDGKPIHPTVEGVRNFVRWFGESKVTDNGKTMANGGKPLVVYHGSTRGGITRATSQRSFFTSSKEVALTYSEDDYSGSKGDAPIVQESYLKMESPLVADADGGAWMRVPFDGKYYTTDDLAGLAARRGNDGLVIKNLIDNVGDEELDPSNVYTTLGKSAQIKSATSNTGNFNPANPDITQSQTTATTPTGNTPTLIRESFKAEFGKDANEKLKQVFVVGGVKDVPAGAVESEVSDNAQAFYNPKTGDIYLIADKIKIGDEIAVLLHEIGHKRLQRAIGTVGMRQLRKGVDAWKDAPEGSNERKVWEAADARAKADGNYDAEIITYAIEEAGKLGIEPKALAPQGTVAKWLASVKAAFSKAVAKLFKGDVPKLTTSDLLAIAKGAVGLELQNAPFTTSDGEVLLSRASSIDETLEIIKTGKLPDEKRSFTEKQDAIVTSFTDSTRPHDVWTRDLPDQGEAAVLIQAKNLASGRESAFNKEVMDNFGSRVSAAIGAIHKANKDIDFDAAQRLAGDWMSATYAPIANQNLLAKDTEALRAAIELAKADPSPSNKGAVTRAKNTVIKRQAAITDKRVIDPAKQKLDIGLAGGYNDATAKQMTTYIEERINKELLQNVADIVYEMNKWKLQKDIELGKVTKEMAAQFDQSGKYVPLTGDPRSDETASDVFGTGSTNQGKDRAMQGRTSGIAQNGIDASFEQIQKTARYHGWADYKDALHGMYERSIEKYLADGSTQQEAQKKTTEDLGISRTPETMQRPSDDVIIYRKNGKAWVYDLGNKAAIDALRSANVEPIPTAYRHAALATRFMARLVTQFMPGFAPVNALRDTWEKSENIRTRVAASYPDMDMDKVARTMLGYSLKSLTTLHKTIMPVVAQGTPLEARLKLDANNADQKLMMEFLRDGGASTWGQFLSTDGKDLAEKLGKMHSLPTKAVETLDVWNNSWELISSFSAYKALRENGMDSKAASNMALELMNFRKGGELMKPIKALYMFAQPIATGGHQLLKTLDTRRGKARFAAYAAAGFVLYGLLRSGEDDDELGVNRMDKRPNYELERNIIIPYGDAGKGIAIPIGFGLPMLAWTYAVNTAKLTLGKQTAAETAFELFVKTPIKTFAPVAPSETSVSKYPVVWLTQSATPTIAKPLVNIALDKSGFGGSLTNARFEKSDKANALEGRTNTPQFYKDGALMSAQAGFDTYPEYVKTLFNGYFIGAANVAVKAFIENPAKEARGKEPVSQFIDRWVKNQDRDDLKQSLYYRYREELNDVGVKASLGKALNDKQTAMLKILEETKKDETSVRTSKAQATKKFGNGKNPAIYEAELKRVESKQSDIQVKLIKKMNELDAK